MEKKVYIGNDTAGFYLKSKCIEYLEGKGIPYVDCGSADDPDIEATRYPFFAAKVAKAVASGEARCGLLICGSGIGISIAANKFKGVRAALVNSTYLARMTRRHNDANILCMGGRVITEEQAVKFTDIFLHTPEEGDRHDKRVDMITAIENGTFEG